MRYAILYILFIINGFHSFAKTQDKDSLSFEYPAINYSTKNGLPSNETYCVFQDSKGYIWIGTDRGIVKFDGYEFKTYTTLDGLTDNVILAINEDQKGNIWYSALNNGQVGYIDSNMVFHDYQYQKEISKEVSKIKGLHLNKIYIDQDDIYIVNNKHGYLVINNEGLKHSSFSPQIENPKYLLEFKALNTPSWHFIYSKLNKSNSSNIQVFNETNRNHISYQHEDCKQRYPTLLKHNSIDYIYDGNNKIVVKENIAEHQKLPNKCSAFRIGPQQFLFSTYGANEENSVVYFSNSPDFYDEKTKLIQGLRITQFIKDLKGGLWISSTRNGLYYFPNLNSRLTTFKDPIEAIFPTNNGICFSTVKQNFAYNSSTGKIHQRRKQSGINCINTNFGKISFFNSHSFEIPDTNGLVSTLDIKGFQNISEDEKYAWDKINLYGLKKNNDHLEITKKYNTPYRGNAYCYKKDSCLLATPNGLVLQLKDTLVKQNIADNKSVRHIECFKKNKVLIYSIWGEGLNILYPNGKNIKLSKDSGLVSNTINTIYMENDNLLWIGTNQGINTLSFKDSVNYELKTILKGSKKLSSPNILQIYSKDSTLFLGTDAGLNVVDLRLKDINPDIPLIIEKIEVNNEKMDGIPNHFVVSYDSNTINFHFTGLTYNMFGKVTYRFRLLGLSEIWIYSKDRKAKFLQLPPGNYTFQLEVKNEFDEWISYKKQISFIINKPFWLTWWFLSLLSLIVISSFGGGLFYYISNLKKEKLFIQNEKTLSEELNQSRQKALNSQLNPHFVFNSLNSIQHFILTQKIELSSDYLGLFAKLMRFVFENSKKLYIPLEDEIQALKLYLSLEKVRHDNSFEFNIEYDKNESANINIPSLLIQPIVENAIWHGLLPKEDDSKVLDICFKIEDENLCITISDNGVGQDETKKIKRIKVIKKQKSSGVQLTQERLSLLQVAIGLPTSFETINLYDKNGSPSGTKVIIKIPNSLSIEDSYSNLIS